MHVGGLLMIVKMGRGCLGGSVHPPKIMEDFCNSKKITCPGARDKLNFRQDKHIFSPNVLRTSKKFTDNLFFLDKDKFFGKRTSKNFDVLARGTSENF